MNPRPRPAPTVVAEADPPIARHYVMVLVVEAALLLALYWLAQHFG